MAAESITVKTADGYTFFIFEDGRVSDSENEEDEDMSWPDLASFLMAMKNEDMSVQFFVGAGPAGVLTWSRAGQGRPPRL